jgi:hypothetical protein
MADWEQKADLCFCLGTSLSGMNADRMANTPAKKSLKDKALGTVLINLQQTPLDNMSAIRVWAKLDDAFKILVQKLNITVTPTVPTIPSGDVYYIPYSVTGAKNDHCRMKLDLRDDAEIKIIAPGAMNEGSVGVIKGKRDGNYCVHLEEKGKFVSRLLGIWWIDAALRGALDQLPLCNKDPEVDKCDPDANKPKSVGILDTAVNFLKSMDISKESEELTIEQSHTAIDAEKKVHQWGLKLGDGAEKFVKEVTYKLHPTFRPSEITETVAPFAIERTGWGTFTVGVVIVLKNDKKIEVEHELTFKASTKVTKVPVPSSM